MIKSHPTTCRALLLVLLTMWSLLLQADLDEKVFRDSIVSLSNHQGKAVVSSGTGIVVQSDRFNGYVLTSQQLIQDNDTLTVALPNGAELVAQVIQSYPELDAAILKVNGLSVQAMEFVSGSPRVGDTVWAVSRANQSIRLARGILEADVTLPGGRDGMQHSALTAEAAHAVALLNNCGQLVGFNRSETGRALSAGEVRRLLDRLNVKSTVAASSCISQLDVTREKAELAAVEARRAQDEAEQARQVALALESKLRRSSQQNESLVAQTQQAWERADEAHQEALLARQNAESNTQELERQTTKLKADADALVVSLNLDRELAEQRFQRALAEQRQAAERRETIILGAAASILVLMLIVGTLLLWRRGSSSPVDASGGPLTRLHRGDLSEYVLDGRDEDGVRYLLRISGDQLTRDDGVVIGRNPKDSPYIINHSDVSRKHARMKMLKDRVFIEDLGSTNGTSVNGEAIDHKGPVSINSGDQVIIGSVVMKLRVLED